jgi:hypothetical protein
MVVVVLLLTAPETTIPGLAKTVPIVPEDFAVVQFES